MKYCTKCGKELLDEAVICPGCGCPATVTVSILNPANALLTKLSERIKTNSIIWIVIAVLQIIIGVSGVWFPLIVGVLNLIHAVNDMSYSTTVLENPNGIVSNYESLTSPIITLVYNLLIGGVIGVAGSIYYFIALRGFVMENKQSFLALECWPAGRCP